MKRVILTVFTVVAALLFCGCNCIQETTGKPVSTVSKKLKVGLYVDDGASGNGVLHLASLIAHSPQTELVTLLAKDIRDKIEAELTYPGQIKVNIVRENRVIDFAK